MNAKLNKLVYKATGYMGYIFLLLFAGLWGLSSIGIFVMSIIDRSILSVIISAICGLCSWVCWTIRKDTLV